MVSVLVVVVSPSFATSLVNLRVDAKRNRNKLSEGVTAMRHISALEFRYWEVKSKVFGLLPDVSNGTS